MKVMSRGRRPRRTATPGWEAVARLSGIALLLLLVAGCGSLGRSNAEDPFRSGPRDGPVAIEIHNDHFSDARIYALWDAGGIRRRIGLVIGKTASQLETEWQGADLRLEVDFIAGGSFVTERITVWPGQTIYLRIPSHAP